MKLYAGFDGGGSKTACCLADENGKLLGVGLAAPPITCSAAENGGAAGCPYGRRQSAAGRGFFERNPSILPCKYAP